MQSIRIGILFIVLVRALVINVIIIFPTFDKGFLIKELDEISEKKKR